MPTQSTVLPRRSRRLSKRRQEAQTDDADSTECSHDASLNSHQHKENPAQLRTCPSAVNYANNPTNNAPGSGCGEISTTGGCRKKRGDLTRPPNAFMLFRSDFWAKEKLKVEPIERDHRDISRIAAICWNNLDDESRAVYQREAEERKKFHKQQFPQYRYSPVRRESVAQKKKRTRKVAGAQEERCQRLASQAMAELQKTRQLGSPRLGTKLMSPQEDLEEVTTASRRAQGDPLPLTFSSSAEVDKVAEYFLRRVKAGY
ncbi:hypothetical protein AX17_000105 [Amanita inopinata Kibby_2008]|nr:hypothetical protein AX17_000105 [Amanita inopinata Kibby_2008]